jgi:DNA polymerase III epsilon subunit family exonuclease
MEPELRAAKLDRVFQILSANPRPTPSSWIATHVFDIKSRDKRQLRRAVRRVLAYDSRFQEVHAGLWETIGWDYDIEQLEEAEFRVLDLEVTGSDPDHNAIIDIAVFRVMGGRIEPLLSTLLDPERPIPPSIVRLTGIDQTMVQGGPTFEEVLPELLDVLEGGIFVAHNASFDYRFLKTVIERMTGNRFTLPHLCTVKLSQRLIHPRTGSRKLHSLAHHLGIPLENRHRAHDDAYATARVLIELLRLLQERGVRTVGEMKLFEAGSIAPEPESPDPSAA